jgi:hypothetical protein
MGPKKCDVWEGLKLGDEQGNPAERLEEHKTETTSAAEEETPLNLFPS